MVTRPRRPGLVSRGADVPLAKGLSAAGAPRRMAGSRLPGDPLGPGSTPDGRWLYPADPAQNHRIEGPVSVAPKQGRNVNGRGSCSVVHGVTVGKRVRNPPMGNMKRSRRTPKWPAGYR